ncbi:MAG: arsenosugar biosynthesis radical SAM (seleno)protein ArsS [Syntrophales bacterium]
MNGFDRAIAALLPAGLRSESIGTLQVNLGRTCNLACGHCHLECSPLRREQMPAAVMNDLIALTRRTPFRLIDITGGAPELHPRFRLFVKALCAHGCALQVRTNLTTFSGPSFAEIVSLLRAHRVALVGSLPCYLEENVDAQRGEGVYQKAIAALRMLNASGYGIDGELPLTLVYNPGDAFLPPSQPQLERLYREELRSRFGLSFTRLIVLTNMPLGRFRRRLEATGELHEYRRTLREAFNPSTLPHLMCRHQVSVDWDGTLYDCDFNLALGKAVNHGAPSRLDAFDPALLDKRRIVTGLHCFGCTAGAGSSCSGALAGG